MMVGSDVVSILICSLRFMIQLQIAVLVDMIRIRKRCSCVFILEVVRNSVSTASTRYSSTISVALTGGRIDTLQLTHTLSLLHRVHRHLLHSVNSIMRQIVFSSRIADKIIPTATNDHEIWCYCIYSVR